MTETGVLEFHLNQHPVGGFHHYWFLGVVEFSLIFLCVKLVVVVVVLLIIVHLFNWFGL